jgi:acyl-CoA thioester hydrolase
MGFEHSTPVKVRYVETDQMGVVHHSNYLHWFEIGRTEWLREVGVSYRKVEEQGLLLPVLETQLTYAKPAYYEDMVQVKTSLAEYTGIRVTFAYSIVRDGETLASGITRHCFTDRSLKPVRPKKVWPEFHQLIQQAFERSEGKHV